MAVSIDKFSRVCGSRALAWLLTANTAIFLILWIGIIIGNHCGLEGNFTMQWLCVSADFHTFILRPWTIVTYMVTHYGFLHLLFNMLWLFWFGRLLQTTLSDRHLLWLFFGGGILGGVAYVAATALSPGLSPAGTYLCGASASVLAIITACAIRTPDLNIYLFLFGGVKLKWVALACIVLTFLGVGGGNPGGQAAHVGGLAFGVIFALLLRHGIDMSRRMPKVSFPRKSRRTVVRDGEALARAVSGRLSDPDRLDQLLDKIRFSGYSSLTSAERRELNALSKRLQK